MSFSGAKLRDIRRRRGLTQYEVTSLSQASLSAVESGRQQPHASTLRKLAAELGVEVADFFEEPEAPKAELPPDFDVDKMLNEILVVERPETPAELRDFLTERYLQELEGMPEKVLKAIRNDLELRVRDLTQGLTPADVSDPERIKASIRAMEELYAVRAALGMFERVLAETKT